MESVAEVSPLGVQTINKFSGGRLLCVGVPAASNPAACRRAYVNQQEKDHG